VNLRPRLPEVLRRNRDFRRFLFGIVLSQLGTLGTTTVMLYHMYELTGSTLQVGFVGAAQGLAIFGLSPIVGYLADRMDRKRLLQWSQAVSLLASLTLAVVTIGGLVEPWHILACALVNTGAATFDRTVRKAVVPVMIPRDDMVQGFALMNPVAEVSKLLGPGLGGILVAIGGPGLMYAVDAISYAALLVIVATIHIPHTPPTEAAKKVLSSIAEGFRFILHRPLIVHLLGLDLSAMVLSAYRVVLPALAVDILQVGPAGYGALAAAPPIGALLGGIVVYRIAVKSVPAGPIVLASTIAYGLAAILLAQSKWFGIALMAGALLGVFDAISTTLRHSGVLLETPDPLLGRVSALYTMVAAGGPALGDLQMGALVGLFGVPVALTLGGLGTVAYATVVGLTSTTLRGFRTHRIETPEAVEEGV